MDDSPWHTKAIDDVLLDKLNSIGGFDFSERDSLCPFGKIISYWQDEPMSLG